VWEELSGKRKHRIKKENEEKDKKCRKDRQR